MKENRIHWLTIVLALLLLCVPSGVFAKRKILTGDVQLKRYLPLIKDKRVAVYCNATGMADTTHVVDLLLAQGVQIKAIIAPEHGFRIKADAGEKVANDIDEQTGLPILSIYTGKQHTLTELVKPFDVLLVDIQDVGLRFYTYYVSMFKLMDACAQTGVEVIVLDRPNPNGFYVDGPILDMKHKSGVGALPIPVVHGMTLGELAQMINGEGWLPCGRPCKLKVITCKHYQHATHYDLPVAPSPNLPNMKAIYLYPSVCLFEGTCVSLGRGTDAPFQMYGHPQMKGFPFSFTPASVPGAKKPPLLGQQCFGKDLRNVPDEEIWHQGFNLEYVIEAYRALNMGDKFFTRFFELLTGVDYIREMIIAGKSASEIREKWQPDVEKFKKQRRPYLLYPEK